MKKVGTTHVVETLQSRRQIRIADEENNARNTISSFDSTASTITMCIINVCACVCESACIGTTYVVTTIGPEVRNGKKTTTKRLCVYVHIINVEA